MPQFLGVERISKIIIHSHNFSEIVFIALLRICLTLWGWKKIEIQFNAVLRICLTLWGWKINFRKTFYCCNPNLPHFLGVKDKISEIQFHAVLWICLTFWGWKINFRNSINSRLMWKCNRWFYSDSDSRESPIPKFLEGNSWVMVITFYKHLDCFWILLTNFDGYKNTQTSWVLQRS